MVKNNKLNHEKMLATEPILPLIIKMSLPSVAAQLVNLLYSIIDRVYIGHIPVIGTDALAVIGITASIIIFITAFSAIISMGAAPLASIALGQGNRARAESIMGNGFTLLFIFSFISMVVCYLYMEPILLFTGASHNTLPYAVDYLNVYLTGTLFVIVATGLNTFISAQGRPGVAMWAVVIGAVLNIILDPIFIFYFNMGVKGAAIATVISQFFSALWVVSFLISPAATLKLKTASFTLNKGVVIPILALGASPFVMASTEAIVGFVLNGSLKGYGDIHVSAMSIIQAALLCASVPLTGFAQGFSPIVSYNFGNGNRKRVVSCFKTSLAIMSMFNLVLVLCMIIFPENIASIFSKDKVLIAKVGEVMPLFFIGMTLFGLQRCCQSMFIALGEAKISIFIAILRKGILLIPLALLLPRWLGVNGIYYAEAISDGTAAIICTAIFIYKFPRILKNRN